MEVATLISTVLTFVIKDPRCTGNARIVNEWRIDPLRNKGKARLLKRIGIASMYIPTANVQEKKFLT